MRTFRYRCPRCQKPFAVEEIALGRPVECPHCEQKIQIPVADSIHTEQSDALPTGGETVGAEVDPAAMDPKRFAGFSTAIDDTAGASPPNKPAFSPDCDDHRQNLQAGLPDPMAPVVPESTGRAFPIPKGDPAFVTDKVLVEDRPKTIVYKGKVIKLRRLSAEEKQRRRFRRRVVMTLTGALVLIAYLLLKVGKI